MTVSIRRGTPSFLMIAVAAEASDGETIAPSRNATGHETPSPSACAATATRPVVKRTRPKARRNIEHRLFLKSAQDVKNAASKRIGGRKSLKATVGSRISRGKPGSRLKARLPSTSRISIGMQVRRAQGTVIVVMSRSSSVASTIPIDVRELCNLKGTMHYKIEGFYANTSRVIEKLPSMT